MVKTLIKPTLIPSYLHICIQVFTHFYKFIAMQPGACTPCTPYTGKNSVDEKLVAFFLKVLKPTYLCVICVLNPPSLCYTCVLNPLYGRNTGRFFLKGTPPL
jgi:hypothetical protein